MALFFSNPVAFSGGAEAVPAKRILHETRR
jgi:hypothetical protein